MFCSVFIFLSVLRLYTQTVCKYAAFHISCYLELACIFEMANTSVSFVPFSNGNSTLNCSRHKGRKMLTDYCHFSCVFTFFSVLKLYTQELCKYGGSHILYWLELTYIFERFNTFLIFVPLFNVN